MYYFFFCHCVCFCFPPSQISHLIFGIRFIITAHYISNVSLIFNFAVCFFFVDVSPHNLRVHTIRLDRHRYIYTNIEWDAFARSRRSGWNKASKRPTEFEYEVSLDSSAAAIQNEIFASKFRLLSHFIYFLHAYHIEISHSSSIDKLFIYTSNSIAASFQMRRREIERENEQCAHATIYWTHI